MGSTKTLSCKLSTPELQQRKATVIAELKTLVVSRKELPDGYSYEFETTNNILGWLTEFIQTEITCCDFFTFNLTVQKDSTLLAITGPKGAKECLNNEIGF